MQKKKILFIITKGNWGGAQRYVFDLATNLPKEKYEVAVAYGEGTELKNRLVSAGIRVISIPELKRDISLFDDFIILFGLYRLFRAEQPDIVHLNSSKAAGLGAIATRLYQLTTYNLQLTTIFTVHGWPFKEPRQFFIKACIWIASYITALLANRVIVISGEDKKLGEKMPMIARKLSLIYNGIEKATAFSKEEARKKLSCENAGNELWLGTIAELTKNKGISYLIESVAMLPKTVRLCIIGDGEERTRLETLAEKLGVANRVCFAGFKENAAQYLKAFDIFVLPSLKEGLPYSVLEAGAAGLPVIASDISGIQDIINSPLVGTLVPSQNAHALGVAINHLIKKSNLRANLGTKLQERIENIFSLEEMLEKTMLIFL